MHRYFLLFVLTFLVPSLAVAGGPFVVNDEGTAAVWDNSSAVSYNPESGSCATFDNDEMLTKIASNIGHWSSIPSISLSFNEVTGSLGSVDSSNYLNFFVDSPKDVGLFDGLNPVIFDDDGEIIMDLFGKANRFVVLGFAGPDGFRNNFTEIVDGQAFFNCFCLAGNTNDTGGLCALAGVTFSEADLDFTMMHEFGHFLGFDHTAVLQDVADAGCNTADSTGGGDTSAIALTKSGIKFLQGGGDCDGVPSMYPQSVDPADQITPSRDDQVIALRLYGSSGWDDNFCTVTGELDDSDGQAFRCVDVHAIPTTDPLRKTDVVGTVAVVSGAFAPAEDTTDVTGDPQSGGDGFTDGPGECISNCGDFTLFGLDAGTTYNIVAMGISSRWVGGSSIGPCGNGQLTGITTEILSIVSGCSAGSTTAMGTVKLSSDGGIDESGGGGSSSSGGLGCSLSQSGTSASGGNVYFILFLFPVIAVEMFRRRFMAAKNS